MTSMPMPSPGIAAMLYSRMDSPSAERRDRNGGPADTPSGDAESERRNRQSTNRWTRMSAHFSNESSLNILALDTSTEFCSAALWLDGGIDERETLAGQTHSESAARHGGRAARPRMRSRCAISTASRSAKAPVRSPGFASPAASCRDSRSARSVPVVGVGTLLAMAAGSGAERVVCCLDARVQEIYHAAYERSAGAWRAVHEPSLCAPLRFRICRAPDGSHRQRLQGLSRSARATLCRAACTRSNRIAIRAHATSPLSPCPVSSPARPWPPEDAAPVYLREKVALRIDEQASRFR